MGNDVKQRKSFLPPFFNYSANYQTNLKIKKFQHELIKSIVSFCTVMLLERFPFPGCVYPAGIAFALINQRRTFIERLMMIGGIYLGITSTRGNITALFQTTPLIIFYMLDLFFWQKRTSRNNYLWIVIWITLRLLTTAFETLQTEALMKTGWEICYSLGLLFFFQKTVKYLENPLKFSKIALTGLIILTGLTIGGTKDLFSGPMSITEVLIAWVLMTVSLLGGGGAGAIMGVSLAIILGIATGGILSFVALYAVPGMLGGLLRDFGRWGTFFGALFGLYFMMKETNLPLTVGQVLPWGVGMASFLVTPRRYFSELSSLFPNQAVKNQFEDQQEQLTEIVATRLNEVAAAFSDISKSFNERCVQEEIVKMDLYSLLEQVCNNICQHCNGYDKCWGENFYSTYREIFDLIALAELYGEVHSHQLKGKLSKNCFQQYKLVATVNKMVERYQTDSYWRKRVEEENNFIINQLDGVSDFINDLAGEISRDSMFKIEIEAKLKSGFNRIGIHVKDIYLQSFGKQGLEIRIKKQSCNQRQECQCLITPMISKLLGTEYMIWEKRCNLDNGECAYCLVPIHTHEIKTSVCKMSRNAHESSGDSHALHELKEGFFVSILSDGMGHGSKAALESNSTVTILERLLDTGIDRNFAVKMVNSMMSLRSPEESFATVDLAIIDLYNGNAEFLKIGAAATYVKRGREVLVIKSTSLPAGILNTVDVEKTVMELKPGDLIVMVTDGVVDSKQDVVGKEEWIKRALNKVEVVGPEALGEYLLNMAKINQDGILKDDMTVIVMQLAEKNIYNE